MVAKSKLNGYVPKDGAQYGITKGTPAEWARFITMLGRQESGLRQGQRARDGSVIKFGSTPKGERSYGPFQFDIGQYGLKTWDDVNDPIKSAQAVINVAERFTLRSGYIRGPKNSGPMAGMNAYFGSIRRPHEVLQHSKWAANTLREDGAPLDPVAPGPRSYAAAPEAPGPNPPSEQVAAADVLKNTRKASVGAPSYSYTQTTTPPPPTDLELTQDAFTSTPAFPESAPVDYGFDVADPFEPSVPQTVEVAEVAPQPDPGLDTTQAEPTLAYDPYQPEPQAPAYVRPDDLKNVEVPKTYEVPKLAPSNPKGLILSPHQASKLTDTQAFQAQEDFMAKENQGFFGDLYETGKAHLGTNWLFGAAKEAYKDVADEVRNTYDPNFFPPPELLADFSDEEQRYLNYSNNAADFAMRHVEVLKKREYRKTLAESGWPEYLITGIPDFAISMAPFVGAGILSAGVGTAAAARFGLSTMGRVGVSIGSEMALTAPYEYYMYKNADQTKEQMAISMAATGAFGLWVYKSAARDASRLAPPPAAAAAIREETDDIIETVVKEAGVPNPMPPRSLEDYGYPPRTTMDVKDSVSVYRDPDAFAAREAHMKFEEDFGMFDRAVKYIDNGAEISKRNMKKVEEALARQSEYLQNTLDVYVKVPSKHIKDLGDWLKSQKVIRGAGKASDILDLQQGQVVLKVKLPTGTKLVDLYKHGKSDLPGTVLFDPRQGTGSLSYEGTERVLKYGSGKGRKVEALDATGNPVIFREYVSLFKPETAGYKGVRTWSQAKELGTGRALDVEELAGLSDDLIDAALNGAKPKALQRLNENLKFVDEGDETNVLMRMAASNSGVKIPEQLSDNDALVSRLIQEEPHIPDILDENPGLGTRWSRALPKLSEGRLAKYNEVKAIKWINQHLFHFGTDPSNIDKGVAQGITIDEVRNNTMRSMGNFLKTNEQLTFRKYLEEQQKNFNLKKGRYLPNRFQHQLSHKFNQEIIAAQRLKWAGRDTSHVSPAVMEMAAAYDKFYKQMFDWMKDPGTMPHINNPGFFKAVGGLDEATEWRPGWTPRMWDGEAIHQAHLKYGDRALHQWISGALWSARRDEYLAQGLKYEDVERIGHAMADKIIKSKNGIDELINGHATPGSIKKLIALVASDPDTTLSPRIITAFENVLGKVHAGPAGKAGTHTYHRTIFDENYVMKTSARKELAEDIGIDAFSVSDAARVSRIYMARNTGRLAWGTLRIADPTAQGKWIVDKGISSDSDFERLYEIVNKLEQQARSRKDLGHTALEALTDARNGLREYYKYSTGQAMDSSVAASIAKNLTYQMYLGNAGFAAIIELPNLIAREGLHVLTRLDTFKQLMGEIESFGKVRNVEGLHDLYSVLERATGFYSQARQGSLVSTGNEAVGAFQNTSKARQMASKLNMVAADGARFVFLSGGLTPVTQTLQKAATALQWDRLAHAADKAGGNYAKLSRKFQKELASIGLSKVEAERMVKMLADKEAVVRKPSPSWLGRPIIQDINEAAPGFDSEVFYKFAIGQNRATEKIVMENSWGSMNRIQNNEAVRLVLALKTFLLGSYTKSMMMNLERAGNIASQGFKDYKAGNMDLMGQSASEMMEVVASLFGQIAMGAATVYTLHQLKYLAANDDRKAELEKLWEKMGWEYMVGAGVSRTSQLGLMPMLWNTGTYWFAPEATIGLNSRTSGLTNQLFGIPLLDQADKVFRGFGGIARSAVLSDEDINTKDTDRIFGLGTNQFMYQSAVRLFTDQVLDLPREKN